MHLIFYTHSLLDLRSFSTLATIVFLVGAAYGFLRLIADVVRAFARADARSRQRARDSGPHRG